MTMTSLRQRVAISAMVLTLLAGCGTTPEPRPGALAADGRISPEDLLIVDCLLPPQVRQLGESMTYLSARRPIRIAARDCARRGGEFVAFDRANMASALRVWLPAAQGGDLDAMVHVGEIHERGLGGMNPDYTAAAEWYRRAAERGDSRAMINLGSLYERGLGVAQDPAQAMNWYRRASGITEGTLELATAEELERRRMMEEESQRLRREVFSLRQQLEQVQGQLDQRQGELERSRGQLDATRRELAEGRRSGQPSEAVQQRMAELESEVQRREREVAQFRDTTERLLAQLGVPTQQIASSEPSIAIISPQLTLTRSGVPAAPLLGNMARYQIVGRVAPVENLRSFRVNDQDLRGTLDANGLFEFDLDVDAAEMPVLIEAITGDGRRVVQNFLVTREFDRAIERRQVSSVFKRRLRSDLGSFHALVIGNNAYAHWTPLETAVNDATAVAGVLRNQYGFNVTLLTNATQTQTLAALSELSQRMRETDNLIVYYAGHGQIDAAGTGHWIPVDARSDDSRGWISNEMVTDFIGTMNARHVLVVADSCYSGTLSGSAIRPIPIEASEQDLLFISRVRARTVLTSGGLQPVADGGADGHSLFARAFLATLEGNDSLLEGYRLFQEVQFLVTQRSRLTRLVQQPEYSALRRAGHEGSEFFFVPATATSAAAPIRLAQR